jgi:hypothetical protein
MAGDGVAPSGPISGAAADGAEPTGSALGAIGLAQ